VRGCWLRFVPYPGPEIILSPYQTITRGLLSTDRGFAAPFAPRATTPEKFGFPHAGPWFSYTQLRILARSYTLEERGPPHDAQTIQEKTAYWKGKSRRSAKSKSPSSHDPSSSRSDQTIGKLDQRAGDDSGNADLSKQSYSSAVFQGTHGWPGDLRFG